MTECGLSNFLVFLQSVVAAVAAIWLGVSVLHLGGRPAVCDVLSERGAFPRPVTGPTVCDVLSEEGAIPHRVTEHHTCLVL